MSRRAIPLAACVAVAAVISPVAGAVEIHRHVKVDREIRLPEGELDTYTTTVTRIVDVAPPDSDDDGFANADDDCPHDGYTGNGGCTPPPPQEPSQATTSAPSPTGGCPSYMAGEASSPTATNPVSGAYGCFQVIPETAAYYNCDLSTMGGQYACMEAICAEQGNEAWDAAAPC